MKGDHGRWITIRNKSVYIVRLKRFIFNVLLKCTLNRSQNNSLELTCGAELFLHYIVNCSGHSID